MVAGDLFDQVTDTLFTRELSMYELSIMAEALYHKTVPEKVNRLKELISATDTGSADDRIRAAFYGSKIGIEVEFKKMKGLKAESLVMLLIDAKTSELQESLRGQISKKIKSGWTEPDELRAIYGHLMFADDETKSFVATLVVESHLLKLDKAYMLHYLALAFSFNTNIKIPRRAFTGTHPSFVFQQMSRVFLNSDRYQNTADLFFRFVTNMDLSLLSTPELRGALKYCRKKFGEETYAKLLLKSVQAGLAGVSVEKLIESEGRLDNGATRTAV